MAISQGGQGSGKIFSEINITPLTDIFLVLLIVMMVIAPMFDSQNQKIKVPSIFSGHTIEEHKVNVEITKAGEIYVNSKQVSAENLQAELKAQSEKTHETHVVLRADKATHSSEVLKVFEAASQAGFDKLTIAGQPSAGGTKP